MAINKPGAYITETLTPNAPQLAAQGAGDSVAVFIGVTDRGGATATNTNNKVVSTPTVVNNWSEFSKYYSYSTVSPFDGSANYPSATSTTYNNTVGTASQRLKYAVKTFFDNGGAQAIILRDVKTDAVQAVAKFNDNQQSITQTGTWTLDYTSNQGSNKLLVSSATADFTNLEAGRVVSFTGVTSAAYTFLNSTYSTTGTGTGGTATTSAFIIATAGVYVGQSVTGTNIPASATVNAVYAGSTSTLASGGAGAYVAGANLTIPSNTNVVAGQVVTITGTGSLPAGTIVTSVVSGTQVKLSNSSTTSFVAGDVLTFNAGVNISANLLGTVTGTVTFANVGTKRWVISDVANDGKSFCILYKNPLSGGAVIGSATQALSGAGIKLNNGTGPATTAWIYAKDHGVWGSNIWVSVTPNSVENTFDLVVYYSTDPTKSTATSLTDNDRVEAFTNLSMVNSDPRYAPSYINNNSDWIQFFDNTSPATGYDDLPLFTTLWNATASTTAAPISSSDYSFSWDANKTALSALSATYTASSATVTSVGSTQVNKVRVGSNVATKCTVAGTPGGEGSTSADLGTAGSYTTSDILPRLDSFIQPLIINYPDAVDKTSSDNVAAINKILSYAASRADSFVIIDPIATDLTPSNVIATLGSYSSNLNYGAAYFPWIKIADPSSPVPTATVTIPPGGAVAGEYVSTDASRGVFKAPAGIYSLIQIAKDVAYPMNAADFDTVFNGKKALNIIRPIPGSGICVMGARTLSSAYSDKYVPTRRSLNYIAANLKSLTQFAIFEPNDQNLWNSINAVVTGFLDGFWRSGGLVGASSDQAYFVKCDATTNTTTAVSNGEVRLEVGVALQRPAEFIIIKLGQINGGATITTSS